MAYIGQAPTPLPLTATDIPDLPASKITSGTFPALNGSKLTNLDAADRTGTLPAISGANLTGISAGLTKISTHTITAVSEFNITSIFSTNNVSVKRLIQNPNRNKGSSSIIIITHNAKDKSLNKILKSVDKKSYILKKSKLIRIDDN